MQEYWHAQGAMQCASWCGPQAQEQSPQGTWAVHTVSNGDMTSAEAWFAASLATAQPGITAYALCPSKQAQAPLGKLRAMLVAGGCTCSLEAPDLFNYIGCVSKSRYKL